MEFRHGRGGLGIALGRTTTGPKHRMGTKLPTFDTAAFLSTSLAFRSP